MSLVVRENNINYNTDNLYQRKNWNTSLSRLINFPQGKLQYWQKIKNKNVYVLYVAKVSEHYGIP